MKRDKHNEIYRKRIRSFRGRKSSCAKSLRRENRAPCPSVSCCCMLLLLLLCVPTVLSSPWTGLDTVRFVPQHVPCLGLAVRPFFSPYLRIAQAHHITHIIVGLMVVHVALLEYITGTDSREKNKTRSRSQIYSSGQMCLPIRFRLLLCRRAIHHSVQFHLSR